MTRPDLLHGRVTRDLAVLFFTAGNSLIRRYYLIKLLETYAETLGIALGQLGIDTDGFNVNYGTIINDFQQVWSSIGFLFFLCYM